MSMFEPFNNSILWGDLKWGKAAQQMKPRYLPTPCDSQSWSTRQMEDALLQLTSTVHELTDRVAVLEKGRRYFLARSDGNAAAHQARRQRQPVHKGAFRYYAGKGLCICRGLSLAD